MEVGMDLDGSYSNEFEAAYDLSRREYDPADELDLIMGHVDAGKYVVVVEHEVCCKFTDALLGREQRIYSVHDTLEAARAACGEECDVLYIMGPDARSPQEVAMDEHLLDVPDEDIPF
jgi:hypothetical protein